jgi:hypothetical protein
MWRPEGPPELERQSEAGQARELVMFCSTRRSMLGTD